MNIERCLEEGFLIKIKPDKELVEKEIKESEYDLKRAEIAFEENDFKWAIIKSYYSMFHAARGLLFFIGFRERRHFAVQIVLEDLVKKGKIESIYLEYFSSGIECREGADYRYEYSEEIADECIENAKKFLDKIKKLVK